MRIFHCFYCYSFSSLAFVCILLWLFFFLFIGILMYAHCKKFRSLVCYINCKYFPCRTPLLPNHSDWFRNWLIAHTGQFKVLYFPGPFVISASFLDQHLWWPGKPGLLEAFMLHEEEIMCKAISIYWTSLLFKLINSPFGGLDSYKFESLNCNQNNSHIILIEEVEIWWGFCWVYPMNAIYFSWEIWMLVRWAHISCAI